MIRIRPITSITIRVLVCGPHLGVAGHLKAEYAQHIQLGLLSLATKLQQGRSCRFGFGVAWPPAMGRLRTSQPEDRHSSGVRTAGF